MKTTIVVDQPAGPVPGTVARQYLAGYRLRQGAAGMGRPSDEDLRRGGAFDIEDRAVPGPAGEPDISVLICRPRHATARLATVYHIHGGGMVVGDNRLFVAEALDWAEVLQLASFQSNTAWHLSIRTRR